MRIEIPTPEYFVEREGILSSKMFRESFPDYGVIFSSSKSASENDFDPELLFGASIENTKLSGDEDRFFKILGGYFFHDTEPIKTTKVFGIALDPLFGITEGGSSILKNFWDVEDPLRPGLVEQGHENGWTFIVELKKEEKFPHSNCPLKIYVDCPEIKDIIIKIGDCKHDRQTGILKREVVFRFDIGPTKPEKWSLKFGDGKETGNEDIQKPISHLYSKAPDKKPVLTIWGHAACDKMEKEVDLPDFKPCPVCTEVKDVELIFGECKTQGDKRFRKVTFKPILEGDEPTNWILHFGDGLSKIGKGKPLGTISYYYSQIPENKPRFIVAGPSPCQESIKEIDFSNFTLCQPCPKINNINFYIKDESDTTRTFQFNLEIEGNKPEKFEWDWGDGTPNEITTEPSVTHSYEIPDNTPANYEISVTSTGPEDCMDFSRKMISVVNKKEQPVPFTCYFWPTLTAFFLALTLNLFLIRIVVNSFLQNQELTGWFTTLLLITVGLSIVAVLIWNYYSKKTPCQSPWSQNWLGIVWVTSLAGTLTSLFLNSCTQSWWWLIIGLLLVLTIVVFTLWEKKYKTTYKEIAYFLFACFFAEVITNNFFIKEVLKECFK